MHKTPKEVVQAWVRAFNRADVDELVSLYHKDAVNHQVAYEPLKGAEKIRKLFELDFGAQEWTVRSKIYFKTENGGFLNGRTHWVCADADSSKLRTDKSFSSAATLTNSAFLGPTEFHWKRL